MLLDWNLTGPKRLSQMTMVAAMGRSGQNERTLMRTKKPVGDKHCVDNLERRKTEKTVARPHWEGTVSKRIERTMKSTASSLEEIKGSHVMRSIEKSKGDWTVARRISRSTGSTVDLIRQVMKSKCVKGSIGLTVTSQRQIKTKDIRRSMESIVTPLTKSVTKSMSLTMPSLGQIKKRKLGKSMGFTVTSLGQVKVRKVGRSSATSLGNTKAKGVTKSIDSTLASSLRQIKAKKLMKSIKSTTISLKEMTRHVTISVDKSLREWKAAKRVTRSNTRSKTTDDEDFTKSTGFARKMFTMTEIQDQTTIDNGLTLPCRIFVGSSKLRSKCPSTKRTLASTTPQWNCVALDYDEEHYCPSKTSRVEPVTLSSCVPFSVNNPVTRLFLKTTTILRDRMTDIAAK
ncbi:Hypothetical protein CINCED_3A001061 [Cinara cedri]|uniref:Uncharacterized protein n=1 Tax=Cinara cedri TaxID=506608 RepID=A0A5E4NG25_9HEMI|nr:Hypothetical protein CINCED_3A001061 [Cinara cedri]